MLMFALLLLGFAVWGGVAAWRVADGVSRAQEEQQELAAALREQEWEQAGTHSERLSVASASAASAATTLPLRAAAKLPVVGDDVRAIQTTVLAVDVASSRVAVPLVQVLQDIASEAATEARVPVAAMQRAAPQVASAAEAAEQALASVEPIRASELHPRLRQPVQEARDGLTQLSERTGLLAQALDVLPATLGADDTREYLVVFQNLAEARPTGGIAGAWALVEFDDGRPTLSATGANDDLERLSRPVRDLGPEVQALYGPDLARSQNVNLSPHFPQAALLLSDLWTAQGREAPHGVVSLDPKALAALMEGTGPVLVAGGPTLTSDNLVRILMQDVYDVFDGETDERLRYLSTSTGAVFAQAMEAGRSPGAVLEAMMEPARQGHVMVWSSVEREQALFEAAGLAGSLPEPAADEVGVYVTNLDGSKLDYYLDVEVRTAAGCADNSAAIEVDLTNSAPVDIPKYVGNHLAGAPALTTHRVLLALYLPPQRGVDELRLDGRLIHFSDGTERGWLVVRAALSLPNDSTRTVTAVLAGTASPPTSVLTQPLLRSATVDTSATCATP